jgi:hypothetical protein
LAAGQRASVNLDEWQKALALNAEIRESREKRGATPLEQARTLLNDYGPLLRLRRYADARKLLNECRDVFEQERDVANLGSVFSALADLEHTLGHPDAAMRFEHTALRYSYVAGLPEDVAISHFNLAIYLIGAGGGWSDVFGHRLAAVLISFATGSGELGSHMAAFARDLRRAGEAAASVLPADFAALCAVVEKVEGVRFRELMQKLVPDQEQLNAALSEVIATALAASREPSGGLSGISCAAGRFR